MQGEAGGAGARWEIRGGACGPAVTVPDHPGLRALGLSSWEDGASVVCQACKEPVLRIGHRELACGEAVARPTAAALGSSASSHLVLGVPLSRGPWQLSCPRPLGCPQDRGSLKLSCSVTMASAHPPPHTWLC